MKSLHENFTKEQKQALSGHRQRLRNRYIAQTNDSLEDNHLLELLLSFAIPRKDVYMLANSLIEKFGGLPGVLSAGLDDLKQVEGVGEQTAILIHLVSTLQRRKVIHGRFKNTYSDGDSVAREMCNLFYGIEDERFLVAGFNSSMRMLFYEFLSQGKPGSCIVDPRDIAKFLLRDGVAHIAIAHNHPGGSLTPSAEDLRSMIELQNFISTMSANLIDMFIVSGESYFKMSDAAKLANTLCDTLDQDFSYSYDGTISDEVTNLVETIYKSKNNS